jgi:hypothetical protein
VIPPVAYVSAEIFVPSRTALRVPIIQGKCPTSLLSSLTLKSRLSSWLPTRALSRCILVARCWKLTRLTDHVLCSNQLNDPSLWKCDSFINGEWVTSSSRFDVLGDSHFRCGRSSTSTDSLPQILEQKSFLGPSRSVASGRRK